MTARERPIQFMGSSLIDLRSFPEGARQDAGYQLGKVQVGEEPSDWKAMRDIGAGAREIRVTDPSGAFRVLYVAKFGDVVYVLH